MVPLANVMSALGSLTLRNGLVFRSAFDASPASAIHVDGGRVVWLGDAADAPRSDKIIDLDGAVVLPGLTDAHVHLFAIAQARLQVPLTAADVSSLPDVLSALRKRADAIPDGKWIFAAGIDENMLAERRLPLRSELDQAAPNNPVVVRRFCGHAAVVNSAALSALNLPDGTADPEGGTFGRAADGCLDGIAMEAAADAIFRRVPTPDRKDLAASLCATIMDCTKMGLTAAVEAAVGFTNGFDDEDAVWSLLRAEAPLPLRLGFMLQLDPTEARERGYSAQLDPDWQTASIKFFADGIVGGRTAAVSEGYLDTPTRGLFVRPKEELTRVIHEAHRDGWQVAVHAIGDEAIAHVIGAMEAAQREHPRLDARHRIEHYFVPPVGGFVRMRELGAMIVTQPGFLTRMNASIRAAFGSRADRYYPGRSAIDAGVTYVGSSDAPTGPLSPWAGMVEAVDRVQRHGLAIGMQEAISNQAAVASYTQGGAYAMKHEAFRGRLDVGMAADLIAVDRNPLKCSPAGLGKTQTLMTMVRGDVVHDALSASGEKCGSRTL
jgi:predicted amidohydrolase YtcJ